MSSKHGGASTSLPTVNTCALAVFLMGLNLGLTVLLTALVAGHSPGGTLETPRFMTPTYGQNQGQMLRRPPDLYFTAAREEGAQVETAAEIKQLPSQLLSEGPATSLSEAAHYQRVDALAAPSSLSATQGVAGGLSIAEDDASPSVSTAASAAPATARGVAEIAPCASVAAVGGNASAAPGRRNATASLFTITAKALALRRREAEAACRAGKCKVYYVHVHKSGGTTLCQAAGANGLRVSLGTNCLVKQGGGSKAVPFWTWSTAEQRRWLLGRAVDFIANEGGAFDAATAPLPQVSRGTAAHHPRGLVLRRAPHPPLLSSHCPPGHSRVSPGMGWRT